MSWLSQGSFYERSGLFKSVENINSTNAYENFRKDWFLCRTVSGENLGNRGNKYFDYICENNLDLIKNNIDKLLECDSFGDPYIYNFSNKTYNLSTSDSTLPPLFLILKSIECFGEFSNNLDVLEIGCGFGINTKIFHDIIGYNSYTHIDVLKMLKLQKTYLNHFNVPDVSFIDPDKDMQKIRGSYDFLISDFAYTELSPELKDSYFNMVIKKCKFGIILGGINPTGPSDNSLGRDDLDLFYENFDLVEHEDNATYGKGGILFFSNNQRTQGKC